MKKKFRINQSGTIAICISVYLCMLSVFANAQTMSRQEKLFVQKGIQYPSWVRNDHASEKLLVPVKQKINIGRTGKYVRIQLSNTQVLSLAEFQVYSGGVNVALGKVTQQSSNAPAGGLSNLAVDGNTNGDFAANSVTQTLGAFAEMEPWWQVDLNATVAIDSVVIWNRTDCCGSSMKGYYLLVSDVAFAGNTLASLMVQPGVSHFVQPNTIVSIHTPSAAELNNAYMSPTYFEVPTYNFEIHQQDPNMWWGLAKGAKPPYPGKVIDRGPSAFEQSNGFLNSLQTANINKAYSFCIGDEEDYSTTNTAFVKGWFDVIRTKYPNVLFHTNQYFGQWNYNQLKTYMQTAKPDMLTFDLYYFPLTATPGGTYTRLFQDMTNYRNWALGGYDGTGQAPIPFGGYVQAFSRGTGAYVNYRPSESEINLNTFAYLTLGAKWINVWIYHLLFWDNATASPTAQYYQYAKVGKQLSKLSPHLSRLRTTGVRFIPGQNTSGNNVSPNNIPAWSATADPYISGITTTNLGTYNNGLRGDVLIGYFKPVPGIANTAGIIMAPVLNKDTKYFMILNGLAKSNGPGNNSVDTVQGKANLVRQKIALSIDFGSNPKDTLYRVNRNTGVAEMMNLTLVSGSKYTLIDTLDGGVADLFYWKNQGLPTLAAGKGLQLSNGNVSAGNVTQLNTVNKFTVETWVKFGSVNKWSNIFLKMLDVNNRIVLQAGPNNEIYANVSNGGNSYGITPNSTIVANKWYHFAMAYDGTQTGNANRLKLYINGVQTALTYGATIPAVTNSNSAPFIVGSALDGIVDEVRVWNSTLSAATIVAWKDKVLGSCHPDFANLQLYWAMSDNNPALVASAGLGTTYAGTVTSGAFVTDGQANNLSGCTTALMSVDKKQISELSEISEGTEKITAYPNPVDGQLNVYLYKNAESSSTISIFNSEGQKIYQTKKQLAKGANEVAIDFANQTPGLYILRVKDANGEKQLKIIKK